MCPCIENPHLCVNFETQSKAAQRKWWWYGFSLGNKESSMMNFIANICFEKNRCFTTQSTKDGFQLSALDAVTRLSWLADSRRPRWTPRHYCCNPLMMKCFDGSELMISFPETLFNVIVCSSQPTTCIMSIHVNSTYLTLHRMMPTPCSHFAESQMVL